MSLADELLADLEEGGEDVADPCSNNDMADIEDIDDTVVAQQSQDKSVYSVARLQDSNEVLWEFLFDVVIYLV